MKRLLVLFLSLVLLAGSAAADPITSYAEVQNLLLAGAYKVPPFDAILTGTLYGVAPSYTYENTYYLFIMVDSEDVSMWSTEADNFFVVILNAEKVPFELGETITVEGKIVSVYSSPVCPYITPNMINGIQY